LKWIENFLQSTGFYFLYFGQNIAIFGQLSVNFYCKAKNNQKSDKKDK